jgi:hypothetical protein
MVVTDGEEITEAKHYLLIKKHAEKMTDNKIGGQGLAAAITSANSIPSNDKKLHPPPNNKYLSINDYYGHKIGFFQTLSLILNALLMVYAQLGDSGKVLSSFNPQSIVVPEFQSSANNATIAGNNDEGGGGGRCNNAQDQAIWGETGVAMASQSDYCARSYNGGCFLNSTCIENCFQELHGYSTNCTTCFGSLLPCGIRIGCASYCISNGTAPACLDCMMPCMEDFYVCSGLSQEEFVAGVVDDGQDDTATSATAAAVTEVSAITNQCNNYDPDAVENWYTVYTLTYGKSIADAWNGGAKALAVIIILFSGIWPYVKNIILVIVWYMPMTVPNQTFILVWLSRLSKYTLVDVFAVIGVIVGVQLQLNLGRGLEVITRVEPRFAIIAFFLATLWEFFQIELIKVMHERKAFGNQDNAHQEEEGVRLFFAHLWIPVLMLTATIALYIVGAISEFIYIESFNGSGGMCLKSYNLVSVGNALVNELSMADNMVPGQTFSLYLVYVLLILAFPILTHTIQIVFIIARSQSKTLKSLIKLASVISCFASVEVLLIGTFAIESKFEEFIKSIAGVANTDLIEIKSGLGVGFFILIPYCFLASFLQMSLLVRVDVPAAPSVDSSKGGDIEDDNNGTDEEGTPTGAGSKVLETP